MWETIEKEATKKAIRRVAEHLTSPDHLRDTEQHKYNYVKKKSILEVSRNVRQNS